MNGCWNLKIDSFFFTFIKWHPCSAKKLVRVTASKPGNNMKTHYHILNGDALKERFPEEITGEIIVARECLVDGEVQSKDVEELFQLRAKFISALYGSYSVEDYYTNTVSEFEKIKNLPRQSTVFLWFEDDLFCQVNFWFVVYLLFHFVQDCTVFLIRPKVHTPYGFGGLNEAALKQAFAERVQLNHMDKIAHLWESYKNGALDNLLNTANQLKESFPFMLTAVNAHIARIPTENDIGRPAQALLDIMEELATEDFGPVFREFNKRESVYGFGDLQVKRLLDEIKNNP